jgi:hypothetical protein
MTHWWEPLRYGCAIEVVVVVAVDAKAIQVVIVADLLQTLAEMTSTLSLMR